MRDGHTKLCFRRMIAAVVAVSNCVSVSYVPTATASAAFVASSPFRGTSVTSSCCHALQDSQQQQQQQKAVSSSRGFTCEHFGVCPGCVVTNNVACVDVVESAKRFFDSSSIQRHVDDSSNSNSFKFSIKLPSEVTQWRTQAKLAVAPNALSWGSRDGCIFGLYERNSHRVVSIPNCVVHHPQINKAIAILTEATANAQTVAYNHTSTSYSPIPGGGAAAGQLRYVQCQVERSTHKVCLTLVWNAEQFKTCQPYLSRLVKEIKRLSSITDDATNSSSSSSSSPLFHSIWLHLNAGAGNNIFSRGDNKWFCLEGPEYVREPILLSEEKHGLLFFTPSTFRQANMDGFDVIAKQVAKSIPPKSTVCELYAGVGLLGLTSLAFHHQHDSNRNDVQGLLGLRWLRCSDENPANLNCFERSVRSMSPSVTGRSSSPYSKQQRQGRYGASKAASNANNKATYMVASAKKAIQEGQALGASVLIVDPPRSGLEESVTTELCKPINRNQPYVEDMIFLEDDDSSTNLNLVNDVTTLIYVSCGFESFTRDCERLLAANAGWKIHSATGYVLFPGSNHIETLTIFKRQPPKTLRKQRDSSNKK